MKVTISDYRNEWADLFLLERTRLEEALGTDAAAIEHIGSTSVEGLAAKPIIDIMIGLVDFALAGGAIMKIVASGYDYIAEYDAVMPYRRFFVKESQGVRTHQIHMVEINTPFWQRLLLFRDYLRRNPQARRQYEALKRRLAEREWQDVNDYAEAKTEFIRRAERQAEIYRKRAGGE
jgi:GrpB-like predicted nucleotidyltransferase (UPF0157 family)